MSFGKEALCLEQEFKKVSSKIQYSDTASFLFGDELMTKGKTESKIDSIIPGKQEIEPPVSIEVWRFKIKIRN